MDQYCKRKFKRCSTLHNTISERNSVARNNLCKSNQVHPKKGKLRIKEEVSSRIFRQQRLRECLLDRRIVLLGLHGSDPTYPHTETERNIWNQNEGERQRRDETIHVGWR